MKGLESRRLLEHVWAPRSAGVCDLRLLSLLRAMLKLRSWAVCGSQLQANAPESRRRGCSTAADRAGHSQPAKPHKLRSAAASPKFPLAFLKSATRLFGCCDRRRSVKSERCNETLWLWACWQLLEAIYGNSFLFENTLIYRLFAGYAQSSTPLLGNLSGSNWERQQDGHVISPPFFLYVFILFFFFRTDFRMREKHIGGWFYFPPLLCRLVYWASVTPCQSSHYINFKIGTSLDLSASAALQVLRVFRRKCWGQRRDFFLAVAFTGNVHAECSKNVKADLFPWMG